MTKALQHKRPRHNHVELARRIVELARDSGLRAGDRLPEQWVASKCAVSRTPVRAALKLLSRQGYIEYRPGQGYALGVDPMTQAHAAPPLPAAEEEELYDAILRDRRARRLDATLTVSSLMRRYDASRKTVQKTLNRLMEEQLVERAPGQRWLFCPMLDSPTAVEDSYAFRLLLEPAALMAPDFVPDATRLSALRTSMEQLLVLAEESFDVQLYWSTDLDFHETVANGCGNRFISEALQHHLKLRRLPRAPEAVNVFRLKEATREHLRIMDFIERGQMDVAADVMRLHLRLSSSQRPRVANRGAPALVRAMPGLRH